MTFEPNAHKARGAFFTPLAISRFLVDWAVRAPSDFVLEPSCGDAAFLIPTATRLSALGASRSQIAACLQGVEIHQPSVANARSRLDAEGFSATITTGDFFDRDPQPLFDAVVGNPPFVRYQNFSGAARAKSLRAALAHGVRLTSLASSWAAFTIHASEFLKDDGRLALVLPAELLSVNYAAEVRRFLLNRFAKVQLVLFQDLMFPGVLEEVVLLLAEGRGSATHFEVYQARNGDCLAALDTSFWQDFTPIANEKWTPALIPTDALETYRELTLRESFTKLIEWGETGLGSVTGNNDYFTLSAGDVARLGLDKSEVLKISPPGARHLRGLTFSLSAWNQLAKEGARCYLFAPDAEKPSAAARSYIAKGEKAGVHKAYKCKVRTPWWRVPLVQRPDLLFTYMNHDRLRLTTNDAGVLVLNSLYGVQLRPESHKVGKATLPIACLNTVTLLGSEMVGRAYGGGMLKHEPKEADLLPVPSAAVLEAAHDELQLLKPQLATAIRQNNLLRAVEMVDAVILAKHLHLDHTQVVQLRHAREALFKRRVSREVLVPRIDDLLQTALRGLHGKPSDSARQQDKKRYSEQVSEAIAHALAEELRLRGLKAARPAPPGERDSSGAERRMAGGLGAKKVDVTWATEEAGLLLAISIKSINFRDSRTGNFQKNLVNRRGDMLMEAVTLHRRFPYAVLAAFFFLDKGAETDNTTRRKSTFANAHAPLKLFTGRNDPAGRDEQFEKFYLLLLDANPEAATIRAYEVGKIDKPVPMDEILDELLSLVAERNPDFYEIDSGSLRPVA